MPAPTVRLPSRMAKTPLDQGLDLHRLVKASTLLVMPEVGHIPQLEDPGAFNRLLTAALRNMGPADYGHWGKRA